MPQAPLFHSARIEDFEGRDTWLFDLDNTLYPAQSDLFGQVERRIGLFVQKALGLPLNEAKYIQKQYLSEYGTTLRGLMLVDSVDPADYLSFVHDIDFSSLQPDPGLAALLGSLRGRKLIYTNAPRAHCEHTLKRLGLQDCFEGIFDIVLADFVPKPFQASYDKMRQHFNLDPKRAVFFEDSARNLEYAHHLGMKTVWIETNIAWARESAFKQNQELADHIHYATGDLTLWLEDLLAREVHQGDGDSRKGPSAS